MHILVPWPGWRSWLASKRHTRGTILMSCEFLTGSTRSSIKNHSKNFPLHTCPKQLIINWPIKLTTELLILSKILKAGTRDLGSRRCPGRKFKQDREIKAFIELRKSLNATPTISQSCESRMTEIKAKTILTQRVKAWILMSKLSQRSWYCYRSWIPFSSPQVQMVLGRNLLQLFQVDLDWATQRVLWVSKSHPRYFHKLLLRAL